MRPVLLLVSALLAASLAGAVTLQEDFSRTPLADGWRIFGDMNLFQWNSTGGNLSITWDSSQTNSYFYHPLGTILTTNDSFSLEFDLQLNDVSVSGYGFEIAVGLLNFAEATGPGFIRGSGYSAPDLAEFDYFPDVGYGATISTTAVDGGGANFIFNYDIQSLNEAVVYHVVLNHDAGKSAITGQIFTDGQLYSALPLNYATAQFFGFRVDTLSVSSFSDANSGGSILAHGVVDNLVATIPGPPIQNLAGWMTNRIWQTQFQSQPDWIYTLERTADFQSWTGVSPATYCATTNLLLQDTNPPATRAFYCVRADRP